LRARVRMSSEHLIIGACAVAVIGVLTGRTDPKVEIQLNGGKLVCEWAGGPLLAAPVATAAATTGNTSVIMTGPAVLVYSGTFAL
jgi:diaminopimelate epimerase